jgi:hypothetical protein
LGDPVKVFNIYGHNTCGNDSICLAGLWKRAGLQVTPARVVGHCVTQAYFDGRWNLFDGDMHAMYLLRDNQTSMNMVLRPGEAITWRWGHASPVKYHGQEPRYPDTICSGLWEYRPDFRSDLWKKGAASVATRSENSLGRLSIPLWAFGMFWQLVAVKIAVFQPR